MMNTLHADTIGEQAPALVIGAEEDVRSAHDRLVTAGDAQTVVRVSFLDDSYVDGFDEWGCLFSSPPKDGTYIAVGDGIEEATLPSGVDVRSVDGTVETLVATIIEEVNRLVDGRPHRVSVCIDSVEDAVDMYGTQRAFKLSHLMAHELKNRRAVRAHFHLDESKLSEHATMMLREAFETVATKESGTWKVE